MKKEKEEKSRKFCCNNNNNGRQISSLVNLAFMFVISITFMKPAICKTRNSVNRLTVQQEKKKITGNKKDTSHKTSSRNFRGRCCMRVITDAKRAT